MLRHGKYSLRPIHQDDLPTLLAWRNSDRISSEMLTSHEITWEEHEAWFQRICRYDPLRNFVFCYEDRPIGYMGFSDWDEKNKTCSSSSYIGRADEVPIDAGLFLDYMGLEYVFSQTEINKVWSYVFAHNKRAYRLNLLMGYKEEGYLRQHFLQNGKFQDVHVVGILRSEWKQEKERIDQLYGGTEI